MKKIMYDYKNRTFLLNMIDFHYDYALLPSIRYIERISLNERRTDDVAVLGAAATSWRDFCMIFRKRRDNRQWRKFGVIRSCVSFFSFWIVWKPALFNSILLFYQFMYTPQTSKTSYSRY